MCEANSLLKKRYGTVGEIIASLSSNVLAKAFSGAKNAHYHIAQKAAQSGRGSNFSCDVFPKCGFRDFDVTEDSNPGFDDNDTVNSSFSENNEIY